MFRRLTLCSVGGVLCPWRYGMVAEEGGTTIELVIESTSREHKAGPGRIAVGSQPHQAL